MSGAQTAPKAAATETTEAPSFLDQVVAATKQTAPDHAQDLVKTLVEQALSGTVTFDKNLTRTFDRAIAAIDRKLSDQLNAIMHHPKFSALEGSWRGLHYLVMNSETGTSLKLRVLNLPKRELSRDLQRAVEFDQSQLFKKIYENEFGTPGGEPYGSLIGDYEWTQHPDDIETLRLVSNVAAAAFAPFISAAGAGMFGFDSWPELAKPRDLAKIFETQDYTKWRSFRDSEDARFVNLVLPRTLARLPYGEATKAIDEFNFEEAPYDEAGAAKSMQHNDYCWMNAAYALGTQAYRRIRANTASAPRSAAPRAAARWRTCRTTCSRRTTATWTRSARPRSPSPTGASSSCPISASCRSATTRIPTIRCSSARSPRRSRRNTIARKRPRMRRSRRACPTSWRRAGSPTT